jgi:CCR4-NOT transcription complex subunit 10
MHSVISAFSASCAFGFPENVISAKTTLLFNLCSLYCLRKEYDQAKISLQKALSMINHCQLPRQAILLSAYIEIMTGNMSQAIQVIKKHHPFVNT